MKRNTLFTATMLVSIFAAALAGCSGVSRPESREVSSFKHISISAFGEVIITQGEEESLTIEAPSNYLRYIETKVAGDTLYIDTRRGFIGGPVRRVTYTLTVKDLNEVTLSGAGTIKIYALETDALEVNLSGAGSIEIDSLIAEDLKVNLSSAGAIVIAGEVDTQEITHSGVGSYESGDMQSRTATIVMSGVGSAVLWVTDELDITITGVGSVSYFGSPSVTQNISGLGSVNSKGEHR